MGVKRDVTNGFGNWADTDLRAEVESYRTELNCDLVEQVDRFA